jgi:hypothetical protein
MGTRVTEDADLYLTNSHYKPLDISLGRPARINSNQLLESLVKEGHSKGKAKRVCIRERVAAAIKSKWIDVLVIVVWMFSNAADHSA